jgi:hypothetical protein
MIDDKKLTKAFDDFEAKLKTHNVRLGVAMPARVSPCDVWHSIRGTVAAIIKALKAVGLLIPIAKKAADVLQTLSDLLDKLCP